MPARPNGGSVNRAYDVAIGRSLAACAVEQIRRHDLVVVVGGMRESALAVAIAHAHTPGTLVRSSSSISI